MAVNLGDIIAIQQPIDLLPGHRQNSLIVLGPVEFFFGQGFVIKHKTIALPEQPFDFITLAIDEDIDLAFPVCQTEFVPLRFELT